MSNSFVTFRILFFILTKTHSLIRHIPVFHSVFPFVPHHPPNPDSPARRKLKLRGSSWKGQTQVFASRPFYITADREPCEPWEMLHRSRHIMRQSESHIKLFTYAANGSLLLSSPHLLTCPLHQPLDELTRANVSLSLGNSLLRQNKPEKENKSYEVPSTTPSMFMLMKKNMHCEIIWSSLTRDCR